MSRTTERYSALSNSVMRLKYATEILSGTATVLALNACTNAQELKELRPTRMCTSMSNSAVYVRDRLASYVAS